MTNFLESVEALLAHEETATYPLSEVRQVPVLGTPRLRHRDATPRRALVTDEQFGRLLFGARPELARITWTDVVLVGGLVTELLTAGAPRPGQDADFSILASDAGAAAVVHARLVRELTATLGTPTYYPSATVFGPPERPTEISHLFYPDIAAALAELDLGSSAAGFDGAHVRLSAHGLFAFAHGLNVPTEARVANSSRYWERAAKYMERGFDVALAPLPPPGLVVDGADGCVRYGRFEVARLPRRTRPALDRGIEFRATR
jgi:hypothetical protein